MRTGFAAGRGLHATYTCSIATLIFTMWSYSLLIMTGNYYKLHPLDEFLVATYMYSSLSIIVYTKNSGVS